MREVYVFHGDCILETGLIGKCPGVKSNAIFLNMNSLYLWQCLTTICRVGITNGWIILVIQVSTHFHY